MIGIIDVGGGLRDIYGCGVLDYCLDHHISFDYAIGISAGSANLASFISKQNKRNYKFYMEYAFRDEYMSIKNYIETRNYVDLDYVYNELSSHNGEFPLDFNVLQNSKTKYNVLAFNALDGSEKYFNKNDLSLDNYKPLSASSCLPIICKPVIINDIPYYDGGLANPIPLDKAFNDGCDKVILILTRPKNAFRDSKDDLMNVKILEKFDKISADALKTRALKYNESLKKALELEKEGKVLIIAPDTIENMSTLTKDKQMLYLLYRKGYVDAEKIEAFLKGERNG